jgi:hypothetical protein
MPTIRTIRQKIANNEYIVSDHALNESMPDDNLEREDVINVIMHGEINDIFTEDERGIRYSIRGPDLDDRMIEVICRIAASGKLIIITVWDTGEVWEH